MWESNNINNNMTCQNCRNPIEDKSTKCEWCGSEILINNNISRIYNYDNTDSSNNNSNNIIENKKFNIYFLVPGIIIFLIWVFGNVTSESEKQRLFGQDDISTWLITSIAFLIIGFIIEALNKK